MCIERSWKIPGLENGRHMGMPAVEEGTNLCNILQEVLNYQLASSPDSSPFVIKRAYRLPSNKQKRPENKNEGTVITILADPDTREALLRAAAAKKEVYYKERRLLFFLDLGPETQGRRRKLLDIRKEMLSLQLQVTVWFPAKLRVFNEGQVYVFTQPDAARSFLERVRTNEEREDEGTG